MLANETSVVNPQWVQKFQIIEISIRYKTTDSVALSSCRPDQHRPTSTVQPAQDTGIKAQRLSRRGPVVFWKRALPCQASVGNNGRPGIKCHVDRIGDILSPRHTVAGCHRYDS